MSQTKKENDHAGRILIVDDEPSVREVLGLILNDEGYQTDFAENGPEGFKKARELVPDLIILDVTMPGMNGFEVCRKIRAESHVAQVPIIMITALGDAWSRLRSIESGADAFLCKPFGFDELLAKVKNITKEGIPQERESLKGGHEQPQNAYDAPIEEWALTPLESRDADNKRQFRRDAGFTSIQTGTSGETPSNQTRGRGSSPRFWRKS